MFIVALFIIAKIWKQPESLSANEWIKKIWYTYVHMYTHTHTHTVEYYSAVKNMKSYHL